MASSKHTPVSPSAISSWLQPMISECGWASHCQTCLAASPLFMICPVQSTLQCGSSVRAKIRHLVLNWASFVINMPALSINYQTNYKLFLVYAIHEIYSMSHNSLLPTFHNQNSLIQALFKPSIKPNAKSTGCQIIISHRAFLFFLLAPDLSLKCSEGPQIVPRRSTTQYV